MATGLQGRAGPWAPLVQLDEPVRFLRCCEAPLAKNLVLLGTCCSRTGRETDTLSDGSHRQGARDCQAGNGHFGQGGGLFRHRVPCVSCGMEPRYAVPRRGGPDRGVED